MTIRMPVFGERQIVHRALECRKTCLLSRLYERAMGMRTLTCVGAGNGPNSQHE